MSRSIEDMIAEVNESASSMALQVMEMFPDLPFPADCIEKLSVLIDSNASMETMSKLIHGFYNARDYSKVIEMVEERCGKRFSSIVEQRMYTHACFEVKDFVKAKETFTEFGIVQLAAARPKALIEAGRAFLSRIENKLNYDYSLAYFFEDMVVAASLPGVDDAVLKAFKAQVKEYFYGAAKYQMQKSVWKSAELAFNMYSDICFSAEDPVNIKELVEKAVNLSNQHHLDSTLMVLNCIDRIADNASKAKKMSSDAEQLILQGRMRARFKAVQYYFKEECYGHVLSLASHAELVRLASDNKDLRKALLAAGLPGDELIFQMAYAFYKTGHCEFIPNIPFVADVDILASNPMLGYCSLLLHAVHNGEAEVSEEFFTQASRLIRQWKPKDSKYEEVRKDAIVSIKAHEALRKAEIAQSKKEARAAEKAVRLQQRMKKRESLWKKFTSQNTKRRLIIGSAFLIGGTLAWLYGGNIMTYVSESVDNDTEEVAEGDARVDSTVVETPSKKELEFEKKWYGKNKTADPSKSEKVKVVLPEDPVYEKKIPDNPKVILPTKSKDGVVSGQDAIFEKKAKSAAEIPAVDKQVGNVDYRTDKPKRDANHSSPRNSIIGWSKAVDPLRTKSDLDKANAALSKGDYLRAGTYYSKHLKKDPNNDLVLLRALVSYDLAEQYSAGIQLFELYARFDRYRSGSEFALIQVNASELYRKLGKFSDAYCVIKDAKDGPYSKMYRVIDQFNKMTRVCNQGRKCRCH